MKEQAHGDEAMKPTSVAATRGSSSRRETGQMGNTCLMAQLSMAERNTAGRRSINWQCFICAGGQQIHLQHGSSCLQIWLLHSSNRLAPEKLMVYVALSGSPQGRSASGSTMPALAATSWI